MRLYIGNFSYNTSEAELLAVLQDYGEVKELHFLMDRNTGKSRGFAFAEMAEADAQQTIVALNGATWNGRPLTVSEALSKDRPVRDHRPRYDERPGKPREAVRR